MAIIVVVILLVAAGLPLSYAITRDLVVAAVLAPLVTGLQCALAAVAMLVVGGSFALWLIVVTAGAAGLAAVRIRRPRASMPTLTLVDLLVMYGPLLLPALLVRRPPVGWDSRSIWWFHAAWIDGGATAFRDALANPLFAFSHPDYPPLAPATIAGAWTVTSSSGLWVAQAVSTLLTLAAVAILAYVVRHLVPTVRPMVARLVALAVALGLWAVADYAITAGYVDHLWAAALAAAVALLFISGAVIEPGGRRARSQADAVDVATAAGADRGDGAVTGPRGDLAGGYLALATVLMAVAAVTKNEGFVAVLLVAVVFTVRARHHLRRAAWLWASVGAGVVWSVASRAFGAKSDLTASGRITQLLDGDLTPLDRARPTVVWLGGQIGWLVLATAVVSVIGFVALRRSRRELGLASIIWPWAVGLGFGVVLVATYVISPYDLEWHLITSADRVGVFLVLLCLATIASWVLVAVAPDEPQGETDLPAGSTASADPTIGAGAPSGGVRAGW